MVGILVSLWDGLCSRAMLVAGSVSRNNTSFGGVILLRDVPIDHKVFHRTRTIEDWFEGPSIKTWVCFSHRNKMQQLWGRHTNRCILDGHAVEESKRSHTRWSN